MKLRHFLDRGFWLCYRRQEVGTFETLKANDSSINRKIDAAKLSMLFAEITLAASAKRRKRNVA